MVVKARNGGQEIELIEDTGMNILFVGDIVAFRGVARPVLLR